MSRATTKRKALVAKSGMCSNRGRTIKQLSPNFPLVGKVAKNTHGIVQRDDPRVLEIAGHVMNPRWKTGDPSWVKRI